MALSSLIGTAGCAFWTAQLSFSNSISARQYCLLGNNRYAAPTTSGYCNDNDATTGSICRECHSWDGLQKRECNYLKGRGEDLGMIPPRAGYQDRSCPVGYEKFTDVYDMEIACPVNSVLALEIFPTTNGDVAVSDTGTASSSNQTISSYYDFLIATPHNVVREFKAHQCLTGIGGRGCGEDTIWLYAYHSEGHCQLDFVSGTGYEVYCDNGFADENSFLGGIRRQNCQSYNGLSCLQVMQHQSGGWSSGTNIVVLDEGNNNYEGLCGLNDWGNLSNPVAWLAGAGVVLLTLLPSLSCWRRGNISPMFLVGLLSEALKNGAVTGSIVSADWECLQSYGLVAPSENFTIFLPYGLLVFSLADTILAVIALFSRKDPKLEESFDNFKWLDESKTLSRRAMTFTTIAIFGGLGGFMQLALILEGSVEPSDGSMGGNELLSYWASWIFIVSASIGGFIGTVLILVGVYTGKMRIAWKTFKFLVGDVPGLVSAFDLAVVLSPGWVLETFNDTLHILLYAPALWVAYKTWR